MRAHKGRLAAGIGLLVAALLAVAGSSGSTYAQFSDFGTVSTGAAAGVWAPDPPAECWPAKKKIWKKIKIHGHWIWTWSWSHGKHYKKVVYGTPGDDIIYGGNQSQIIMGLGGNDKLVGGNSGDCLVGGPGRDWLIGGNAKDILIGGGDGDFLDGGNGKDWLDGLGQWLDDLGDLNECIGGRGVDQVVNCLLEGEIEAALMEQNVTVEDPVESTIRRLQETVEQESSADPAGQDTSLAPLPDADVQEEPQPEGTQPDAPKTVESDPAPPVQTEEVAPPPPSPSGTTPDGQSAGGTDATCADPTVASENCEVTP